MLVFPLVISLLVGLFIELHAECWEKDSKFFAVFAMCVLPMWLCYFCIAVADTFGIF